MRAEEMEAVGFCWTSPDGGSGELPVEEVGTYLAGGMEWKVPFEGTPCPKQRHPTG